MYKHANHSDTTQTHEYWSIYYNICSCYNSIVCVYKLFNYNICMWHKTQIFELCVLKSDDKFKYFNFVFQNETSNSNIWTLGSKILQNIQIFEFSYIYNIIIYVCIWLKEPIHLSYLCVGSYVRFTLTFIHVRYHVIVDMYETHIIHIFAMSIMSTLLVDNYIIIQHTYIFNCS